MAYLILIAALVGGYFYYTKVYVKSQQQLDSHQATRKKLAAQQARKSELRLENVQKGGFVSLSQVGPEFLDLDITIRDRHLVKYDTERSIELEGETAQGDISISLDPKEPRTASVTLKKLKLSQIGLDVDAIRKIAQAQSGTVTYLGTVYHFSEEDQGVHCQGGNELEGESFRYMEFESDDEKQTIHLVDFDGKIEAYHCVQIRLEQVTVLSVADSSGGEGSV